MTDETMSIIRDGNQDYLDIPIPGAEGVQIKVLKVDEPSMRVLAKVKFAPGSKLPRHVHYCRAIAYTISGEWAYDEGAFTVGESAYEEAGNDHTPWSDTGAELYLVFDGDESGRFLDNYLEDGTVVQLDMPFFKAYEGISREQAAELDPMALVTITPPAA